MIDWRQKFAFLQLVLAKSLSVEQAAKRYGCQPRTIRRWCWVAPISCRIAGGSRRVSVPLADVYAAGECRALRDFLDGHISEIITDAFDAHGAGDVLDQYAKKGGNPGIPGHRDVVAAGDH
jgi:hypothetical protein